MSIAKTYSKRTLRYHSPTATQSLISLALMRIKQVTTRDCINVHTNIRTFRVYKHLPTAIHYYKDYPNQILCFNVIYTKPVKKDTDDKSTGDKR